MISHILFDNNGVLTTSDCERTHQIVARYLKISQEKVRDLFGPDIAALDTGQITQQEFYRRVLFRGNFTNRLEDFEKLHLNAYIAKPENQKLALMLRKRYSIALLTNFGDAFWKMYPVWGLNKVFKKKEVFLSADLGLAKPNPVYFTTVLERLKIKPQQAVFIDDNSDNIASALKLGINSVLYTSHQQLLHYLESLNVKI